MNPRMRAILLLICCLLPTGARTEAAPATAGQTPTPPAPAAAVSPAPVPSTKPRQVDRMLALLLVRSTVIALDQANKSGNYAVLHALASPSFQQVNTPAELTDLFANFRREKFDLSPGAILEPQLAFEPRIEANGLLHIAGDFAGRPSPFHFDLMYQSVDGRWLLEAISAGSQGSQDKPKEGPQSGAAASAAAPAAPTPPRPVVKPGQPQPLLARPDQSNQPQTLRKPQQMSNEPRSN
ncbi:MULTISPECIES: hypothetical protein [unclassified Bradyrhizobium]|uniref:hypothetical protein n=2 Tax=unclassified Bradyrhizobium TaxID=2631580 RepID=UPI0029163B33|nr:MULTISPECIES: hypothetical protein [unclassified Bradyrhizobium]